MAYRYEKILIYQAEKIDGLYVQRIHIYYHFIGKLSEDDKNIAVAEPIIIHTRKGVKLTNKAPDNKAN